MAYPSTVPTCHPWYTSGGVTMLAVQPAGDGWRWQRGCSVEVPDRPDTRAMLASYLSGGCCREILADWVAEHGQPADDAERAAEILRGPADHGD